MTSFPRAFTPGINESSRYLDAAHIIRTYQNWYANEASRDLSTNTSRVKEKWCCCKGCFSFAELYSFEKRLHFLNASIYWPGLFWIGRLARWPFRVCKPWICCNNITLLQVKKSILCGDNAVYCRVRFRHKKHLVRVRKRSCFGLRWTFQLPQTCTAGYVPV